MRRSWTARLATTIAASQLLFPTTLADSTLSYLSSVAQATPTWTPALSSSATPTWTPALSSSATPTSSGKPTVHTIKAGAGGFKFDPQEITNVSVGDIVTWEFYPPDHSVARAEFGSACVPYEYTGK